MTDRDRFIAQKTKELHQRQADLIARGSPDESIPQQIRELGHIWDATHQARKWGDTTQEEETMDRKVTILGVERAYDGFFKVDAYHLRQEADGRDFEFTRLNFERGHAAALLLWDPETDEVLCVEEFRIGMLAAGMKGEASFSLGPIAGMIDEGETPRQAAIREAREEAGVEISEEDIMAEFTTLPSPGGSSETVTMILAGADLSDLAPDAIFGEAGEAEQCWRRILPRSEVMSRVDTEPMAGHLTVLMMKLEQLRLERELELAREAAIDPEDSLDI
jgi:ADP-ribose pyrophosphatase